MQCGCEGVTSSRVVSISNSEQKGQEERQLLVVPDSMVPEVLATLHNHGGYFRVDKTLNRVAKTVL